MKFGIRTPSPSRSLKARTTGKWKRQVKSSINPLYGKSGTGWVKNPSKAAYNKVYHQTTASVFTPPANATHKAPPQQNRIDVRVDMPRNQIPRPDVPSSKSRLTAFLLCLFLGWAGAHRFYVGKGGTGVLWMFSFGIFGMGWFVDLIMVALGSFKDNAGQRLT